MRLLVSFVFIFFLTASGFSQLGDRFRFAAVHTVKSREGYSIFYPILGEEYKGVVVLLHSNQVFNPSTYGGLIDELLQQNYLVIFPSYQSFLQSKNSDDIEYITQALQDSYEEIGETYDAIKSLPVAYIGHSMGGIIAFQLADIDATRIKNPAAIISVCPEEVPKHRISDIRFNGLDKYDLYLVIEEAKDRHYKKSTGQNIISQLQNVQRYKHVVHEPLGSERSGHLQFWSTDKRFSSKDNGFPDYFAKLFVRENTTDINFYYPLILDALSCAFERKNCDYYIGNN